MKNFKKNLFYICIVINIYLPIRRNEDKYGYVRNHYNLYKAICEKNLNYKN